MAVTWVARAEELGELEQGSPAGEEFGDQLMTLLGARANCSASSVIVQHCSTLRVAGNGSNLGFMFDAIVISARSANPYNAVQC